MTKKPLSRGTEQATRGHEDRGARATGMRTVQPEQSVRDRLIEDADALDVSPDDVRRGLEAFMTAMKSVSLALIRVDEPAPDEVEPPGRGSGLLVEHDGKPTVLTCAHVIARGQWAVELHTEQGPAESEQTVFETPVGKRRTPLVLLASANLAVTEWDFAWTTLVDLRGSGVLGSLLAYRGPLDQPPTDSEPYGFLAWNRDAVYPGHVVIREAAYELGMEFAGEDPTGMYRFRLDRAHRGHDFYRGASGAPIAAPDGTVVALLSHGAEASQQILTAVPLAKAVAAAWPVRS